jgi:hypothetical protein
LSCSRIVKKKLTSAALMAVSKQCIEIWQRFCRKNVRLVAKLWGTW